MITKNGKFIQLLLVINSLDLKGEPGREVSEEASGRASSVLQLMDETHEKLETGDQNWDDLDLLMFAVQFMLSNIDGVNENLSKQMSEMSIDIPERMKKENQDA